MFYESDIFLMARFFFPKSKTIYALDPGNAVKSNIKTGIRFVRVKSEVIALKESKEDFTLINVSGAATFSFPIDFTKVSGILSFNNYPETSVDYFYRQLFYLKNEREEITWVVSENHRNTDFIADTDEQQSITDVGNFFSVIPSTLRYLKLKLGFLASVSTGKIQVLSQNRIFDELNHDEQGYSFSIKIKNCHKDGIITSNFFLNNKIKLQLKRPVWPAGSSFLKQEEKAIGTILGENEVFPFLPSVNFTETTSTARFSAPISISSYYTIQNRLNDNFLNSIASYSSKTLTSRKNKVFFENERMSEVVDLVTKKVVSQNFPRALGTINYVGVFTKIEKLYRSLNPETIHHSSLTNNNLAPEKIGYSGKQIFLSDWTKSRFDLPVFYDLFEYIFSYYESLEYPEYEQLISEIEYYQNHPRFQEMTQNLGIDFRLQLELFLAHRLIMQSALLLNKKLILPEENRNIYLWKEFFENCNLLRQSQEE